MAGFTSRVHDDRSVVHRGKELAMLPRQNRGHAALTRPEHLGDPTTCHPTSTRGAHHLDLNIGELAVAVSFASRRSVLGDHILGVQLGVPDEQVCRVTADPVVAVMADEQTSGDLAEHVLICDSTGHDSRATWTRVDRPVPACQLRSQPWPTLGRTTR